MCWGFKCPISAEHSPLTGVQYINHRLHTRHTEFIRRKPCLKYIETCPMVLGTDGWPRAELLVADQLHFDPSGYALLADQVRPFLPSPPAQRQ